MKPIKNLFILIALLLTSFAAQAQNINPNQIRSGIFPYNEGFAAGISVNQTGTYSGSAGTVNNNSLANLNNLNISSHILDTNGASFSETNAITGAVNQPSSATIANTNAVAGHIDANAPGYSNSGSNAVAGFFTARARNANASAWGSNPLCLVDSGYTAANCVGEEVDMDNDSGTDATTSQSNRMDGLLIISGGTNKGRFGMQIQSSGGGNYWQDAAIIQNFNTLGISLGSYQSGAVAIQVVPPANDTNSELVGRNAANSNTVWKIDDSGNGTFAAFNTGGRYQLSGTDIAVNSAPTISSGFGSSPSVVHNNGTVALTINVGTGGSATNGIISLPTEPDGWACHFDDVSTQSSTVFVTKQIAYTTSSATIANFNTSGAQAAWASADILVGTCIPF